MDKRVKLVGLMLVVLMTAVQAQDTTKVKGFDYSKLKPVVHFFANAEYNPSAGVSKDYSFWIGRMLFGFQYDFNSKWSSRVLVDRTRLTGSMNTMYVKVANLRYTPNDRWAIEGGAINQNNYIPFETFWGYRFIAETYQDRYFALPSTDIGVCAYYKAGKMFSLDGAITNGEGPRIDQDNFGKIKLAAGLNFYPTEHIVTRVFFHQKSFGEPGLTAKEHLLNAYAGYQYNDKFRIGAEFIYVDGYAGVPGLRTYGGTAFGVLTLYKSLKFMTRFDRLNVIGNGQSAVIVPVSGNAIISGLLVSPIKGITLCLNYQGFFPELAENISTHRLLFSFEYKL